MVYIQENWSLYGRKVLQKLKLKLKFWRSFNLKNIHLLRKMQTILNVQTLNWQKQIFCPECENPSFVKINQRKILRKLILIFFLLYLFSQWLSLLLAVN